MIKLRTGHANRGLFKYWYHRTMMGDMYTVHVQKQNNYKKEIINKKYTRLKLI